MTQDQNHPSTEKTGTIDIRESVSGKAEDYGLATAIHELVAPFGGIELEIPPRDDMVPFKSIFDEE